MKTTYKKTVSTSSIVIAPDLNAPGAADWSAGSITEGQYVYNPANNTNYWAIGAGTTVTAPTHTRGVDTVDSIEWLAIGSTRLMDITGAEGANVEIVYGAVATADEGTTLNVYNINIYSEKYSGAISAISDVSATVKVSLKV